MAKKRLRDESIPEGREIWKAVDLAASRAPEWIKDKGMQEIADGIDAQRDEIARLREYVARLRELLQEARSALLAYSHFRVEELHDLAERINAALGGKR